VNGYVTAGYIISIGSLSAYGVSLSARVRAARARAGGSGVVPRPDRPLGELATDEDPGFEPGSGA
jgi:hypothetical protein